MCSVIDPVLLDSEDGFRLEECVLPNVGCLI